MANAFEQAFSDLAYSFLQEKSIALVEHLIGFEVVHKNDDGSRGLGLFAFKIGEDYYYAPVFFINGEIKPLDLIYNKNQDLFMPLNENWGNFLLKKNPLMLGEASTLQNPQYSSPSLEMLSHPPLTGKYVTASLRDLGKKSHLTMDYLTVAPNYVKEAFLRKLLNDRDYVAEAIEAYGFDKIKSALSFHQKQAASTESVEIVTAESSPEEMAKLEAREREEVYKNEIVVKDKRPKGFTSELYDVQFMKQLQNPQRSGLYQLLNGDCKLVEALIFLDPKDDSLHAGKEALVIEVDSGHFVTAPVDQVWVRENTVIDDLEPVLKKLGVIERTAGKINKVYCLIGQNNRAEPMASRPFDIRKIVKDTDGVINYSVSWREGDNFYSLSGSLRGSDGGGARSERNTYAHGYEHMRSETNGGKFCYDVKLSLVNVEPKSDARLYMLGDEMIVPKGFRLIPLYEYRYGKDASRFSLGGPGAVARYIRDAKMSTLGVRSDGSEYFLSYDDTQDKPMAKVAAVRTLCTKYGLAADDALDLISKANEKLNTTAWVFIKKANIGGVTPFQIPDPIIMQDSGVAPKGLQFHQEQLLTNQSAYPQAPQIGGLENLYQSPDEVPPDLDMSAAMMAAQNGQQQVFDHASLASLVRISDTAEAINRYLPDLDKALDRLGRLLFLFWWNHDEFSELFGITEMSDLEDQFRNVFKSFGDLVLELKKKERARLPMQ